MDPNLIYTFLTISIVVPSFIVSLTVPYLLGLRNAEWSVKDRIQKNKENCQEQQNVLSKIEKIQESLKSFRKTLIRLTAVLSAVCILSFIYGLLIIGGCLSSCCVQLLKSGIVGALAFQVGLLSITIAVGTIWKPVEKISKLRKLVKEFWETPQKTQGGGKDEVDND